MIPRAPSVKNDAGAVDYAARVLTSDGALAKV
jgi:hypothetical protein